MTLHAHPLLAEAPVDPEWLTTQAEVVIALHSRGWSVARIEANTALNAKQIRKILRRADRS